MRRTQEPLDEIADWCVNSKNTIKKEKSNCRICKQQGPKTADAWHEELL